jgi:hypothetical protein
VMREAQILLYSRNAGCFTEERRRCCSGYAHLGATRGLCSLLEGPASAPFATIEMRCVFQSFPNEGEERCLCLVRGTVPEMK